MITGESGLPAHVLVPEPRRSVLAIEPPGSGVGYWAGAPSAALGDDGIYLAYRMRRPVGHGRGYAVAIARSADGEHFETLPSIGRELMGTESLERPSRGDPAVLVRAGGDEVVNGVEPGASCPYHTNRRSNIRAGASGAGNAEMVLVGH